MKIYAFEVRADETEYFNELAVQYETPVIQSSQGLTADKIKDLEPGSGVSVLGMFHYGENEMKLLADQNIRYLSTRTIGYNHIDLDTAKKYGIHVCNARYAPNGVADYTVMMMLLCLRGYKQALWRMQVNDFSLGGLMGREMKDLTIGVVGTGRIGRQVMKNLSGFGCRMLCYDLYESEEAKKYGTYVSLDELYQNCDVITFHLALSKESEHMVDDAAISKMKDGVILINCARGGLMDVQALIRGIESQKIGALGLDTIESEEGIVHRNLKTDIFSDRDIAYLRQFKNVVYTYHMAFYTDAAVKSMAECGVKGILDMANGIGCETQLC